MPNKRGQNYDKLGKEHKRQVINDRGNKCYMDQVGELHQEIVDLQTDLGQVTQKAAKYKARLEAEQAITDMYMKIAERRTKWLKAYMALAVCLTGYIVYIAFFTNTRF